jgi:hypothetical protein
MQKNDLTSLKKDPEDAFGKAMKVLRFSKAVLIDPVIEIYRGYRSHSLPIGALALYGILASGFFGARIDEALLHNKLIQLHSLPPGKLRAFLGAMIPFSGFWFWGYLQMGLRAKKKRALDQAFINSKIETHLNKLPEFVWDYPLDESTGKLRVRSSGIPLASFNAGIDHLRTQLNRNIVKIENPKGDMQLVDIIYTTENLKETWNLESAWGFSNYSFPVGKSFRGTVKASFTDCPHFLIAGASGGGKSSFIRMMLTVLLTNHPEDLEVYFIDFKGGMENQVFEGFWNVHLVSTPEVALQKLNAINRALDDRMLLFKSTGARDIEAFNKKKYGSERTKRIIVVVDEISELIAHRSSPNQNQLREITQILNRISRMGRAPGINLVIGVQKPDARNLDATIKSNLGGIVCFPVTHYSQSVVVLGNARAADLSTDHPGRAIWQRGSSQFEVQTPHLTEEGVMIARKSQKENLETGTVEPQAPTVNEAPAESVIPQSSFDRADVPQDALEVETHESPFGKEVSI